jgi:hypothetical protein
MIGERSSVPLSSRKKYSIEAKWLGETCGAQFANPTADTFKSAKVFGKDAAQLTATLSLEVLSLAAEVVSKAKWVPMVSLVARRQTEGWDARRLRECADFGGVHAKFRLSDHMI